MAYCSSCGSELADEASFCSRCGVSVQRPSSTPEPSVTTNPSVPSSPRTRLSGSRGTSPHPRSPKTKMKPVKMAAIAIGAFIVLLVIVGIMADSTGDTERLSRSNRSNALSGLNFPPTSIPPTPTPTFVQAKAEAVTIPYDDLFRNNERHVGKQVFYRAKIVQVINAGTNSYQFRANLAQLGGTSIASGDTVFLHFKGKRFLDDDLIEFIGTVDGLLSYEAVLGQEITIPEISTFQVRLLDKLRSEPPNEKPLTDSK